MPDWIVINRAWIMVILYAVGIVGFELYPALFQSLVPYHLLTIGVLLFSELKTLRSFLLLLLVGSLGWGVELLGVKTGVVFGEYSYGETLGLSLFGIPLLIGLNWMTLSYASYQLSLVFYKNRFIASFIAAAVMTSLDVFIEPVAIALDFWTWSDVEIPVQNYIAWFVISFLFQMILHQVSIRKQHAAFSILYLLLQLLFFLGLKMFLL